MKNKLAAIFTVICVIASSFALSQEALEIVGEWLYQLRQDDPNYHFTNAMLDIEGAEAHFEAALSATPRAALGQTLPLVSIEDVEPGARELLTQIQRELSEARIYVRNAALRISRGIEAGGGGMIVSEMLAAAAEARGWNVAIYADFYKLIQGELSRLDEILGAEDPTFALTGVGEVRGRLIEIRTVMTIGAPATN